MLVYDFDGVICDSLDESMMVAWYAHDGQPVARFLTPGLAGVPAGVLERFRGCRPFMRHLPHFLVPLLSEDIPTSYAAFAERFDTIPTAEIERFATAAECYRRRLRADHAEAWCAQHRIELRLRESVDDAYIATARDRASVAHILRAHGIEVSEDRVFGSLRDKTTALARIAEYESRPRRDIVLVDDSIQNCVAAQASGFGAYWAAWGYHGGSDAETAIEHGIAILTVEDLLERRRDPGP